MTGPSIRTIRTEPRGARGRSRCVAAAVLAAWLGGCASWPIRGAPDDDAAGVPDPLGVVRIEPTVDVDDESVPQFDPRRMEEGLARRFPGLRSIDLLKVLLVPGKRKGLCATTVSPPWETAADVSWSIAGRAGKGSGIRELKESGWWPIYRSPQGQGFERRGRFDAVDLKVTTEVACSCLSDEGAATVARNLELRFRWKEGEMPEVSASMPGKDRPTVLSPTITYGHLVTYDFEARTPLPNGAQGTCDAHLLVSILADPPIL